MSISKLPIGSLSRSNREPARPRCRGDAVTKYEIATAISQSLPEFPPQLPPERKIWLPEDYRMSIFDAVSLIFTHFYFQAIKPNTASMESTGTSEKAGSGNHNPSDCQAS